MQLAKRHAYNACPVKTRQAPGGERDDQLINIIILHEKLSQYKRKLGGIPGFFGDDRKRKMWYDFCIPFSREGSDLSVSIKKRNPAMDVIRCFALMSVICVHYFLNTNYYYRTMEGMELAMLTCIRSFFMICVPMFLILSGYLMCNKMPEKSYFPKIARTLGIYVLASLACAGYKVWRKGASYTLLTLVKGLTDYSLANYSWYIEMYIGLFFLIPFLNVMWKNLTDVQRKYLLAVMIGITAAPAVVNTWGKILPDWWTDLYPVSYYLIGAALRTWQPKLNKAVNLLAVGAVTLALSYLSWRRSFGGTFVWGNWQGWHSLLILANTVLVFIFLEGINWSRLGDGFASVAAKISKWSLGAYLVSYIFDQEFYPRLGENLTDPKWALAVVPAVLVCSVALSAVLNGIYDGIAGLFALLKKKEGAV